MESSPGLRRRGFGDYWWLKGSGVSAQPTNQALIFGFTINDASKVDDECLGIRLAVSSGNFFGICYFLLAKEIIPGGQPSNLQTLKPRP